MKHVKVEIGKFRSKGKCNQKNSVQGCLPTFLVSGGTRIETLNTLRALELQNLYIRLKRDDIIPEERVIVLVDLKENITKFDSPES